MPVNLVCEECGSDDRLAIDHVIPISKNGRLEPGNAVVLCKSCNSSKSNKDLKELEPEFASLVAQSALSFQGAWKEQFVL